MDLKTEVVKLLLRHHAVTNVQLAGSRERGDANLLSDWDFLVETNDAGTLRESIPDLLADLDPLVGQWDRLGERWNYMLILTGGVKVDIILDGPTHEDEPPWEVSPATLPSIDDHFWDWILWLGSKNLKGDTEMVTKELRKLFDHLLEPMGVARVPLSIEEAISAYTTARDRHVDELGVTMQMRLQREVLAALGSSSLDA